MLHSRKYFSYLQTLFLSLLIGTFSSVYGNSATGNPPTIDSFRAENQQQIRQRLTSILDKFCQSSCDILAVEVNVNSTPADTDELGFEAIGSQALRDQLSISEIKIDLQIDDFVSTKSREKLTKIIENSLKSFTQNISTNWSQIQNPQIGASTGNDQALKSLLQQQLEQAVGSVFNAYCPDQCLLAHVFIDGDSISGNEAKGLSYKEIFSDKTGKNFLHVKQISLDMTLDSKMSDQERARITQLIKNKTRFIEPIQYDFQVIEFPESNTERSENLRDPYGLNKLRETLKIFKELASTKEIISTNKESQNSQSLSQSLTNNKEIAREVKDQNTTQNSEKQISEQTKNEKTSENNSSSQSSEESKNQLYLLIGFACLALIIGIMGFVKFKSAQRDVALMTQMSPNTSGQQPNQSNNANYSPDHGYANPSKNQEQQNQNNQHNYDQNNVRSHLALRQRIYDLKSELTTIFSENPRIAKDTFTRLLQEDGFEETGKYVHVFGSMIIHELLSDSSLQRDIMDLSEFYQKSNYSFTDEQTLQLLQTLRTKVTASEMRTLALKDTDYFEFLRTIDAQQIFNLIKDERPNVQSIVLSQIDPVRRRSVFSMYLGDAKMLLMRELAKALPIPKEYLFNVSQALQKKMIAKPEFDSQNIRSSDILLDLLEKADLNEQRNLMRDLMRQNPESARAIKMKLVTIELLPFLKDGHLLEIVLGLERLDLLNFLVGTTEQTRDLLISKAPEELAQSWMEEIQAISNIDEQVYRLAELKIINRVKSLAHNGAFRILDLNERLFRDLNFDGLGQNEEEVTKVQNDLSSNNSKPRLVA